MMIWGKKAQGLSTNAIVLIVLAVVVLVILIVGFTLGWSKFAPWLGGDNVDDVVQQCNVACSTAKTYDYCKKVRDVRLDEGDLQGKCVGFAETKSEWGFKKCDSLKCDPEDENVRVIEGDLVLYALSSHINITKEKQNLTEIKEKFNIPEKFCYWKSLQKVYLKLCPNFDEYTIKKIFDAKKNYREDHNTRWATLNYDWDYCVEIVFDYDLWDEKMKNLVLDAGGAYSPSEKKFYLNPHVVWKARLIESAIYHEAFHSLQKRVHGDLNSKETHLGEGKKYSGRRSSVDPKKYLEDPVEAKDFIEESMAKKYCTSLKDMGLAKNTTLVKEFYEVRAEYHKLLDEHPKLEWTKGSVVRNKADELEAVAKKVIKFRDGIKFVSEDCYEREELSQKSKLDYIILVLREWIVDIELDPDHATRLVDGLESIYHEANLIATETQSKGYVGKKNEIDPRLSEIQRWWLEKTSPECEIIYTPERAEFVLKEFLGAENLKGYYLHVQLELKNLLLQYEGTEYEDDIFEAFKERMPGLAYEANPEFAEEVSRTV
jgi:hypothetical protein